MSGLELLCADTEGQQRHFLFKLWLTAELGAGQVTDDDLQALFDLLARRRNLTNLRSRQQDRCLEHYRRFRGLIERLAKLDQRDYAALVRDILGESRKQQHQQVTEANWDQQDQRKPALYFARRIKEELVPRARRALVETKAVLLKIREVEPAFQTAADGTFDWRPAFDLLAPALYEISGGEGAVRMAYDQARGDWQQKIDTDAPNRRSCRSPTPWKRH